MAAYYNDNDPKIAAWLQELIKARLIADGEVDTTDIRDVQPADLRGFRQVHVFAGIGGWSVALRLAGWHDARAVWTGSCPCQPFSVAGARRGASDARHLWPAWYRLIRECRPATVFGEQVDSPDGIDWLDAVCADLERSRYAVAPVGLCAAGCGAPGLRHRLWFVAHPAGARSRATGSSRQVEARWRVESGREDERMVGRMADVVSTGRAEGWAGAGCGSVTWRGRIIGGLANADCALTEYARLQRSWRLVQPATNPLAGVWGSADWLWCDDGKTRPVEPGTFPLAHGLPARVGRLRGYGNAIVPQVAAEVNSGLHGDCRSWLRGICGRAYRA